MSREAKVINLTRGGLVCERAVVADRALPRMRGLLGRRSLPVGEGMLLRPAPSVHTAFMRFPIDVLFLDEELTVVKVTAELRPWRVASASCARAVLELAAGETVARGVQLGDRLGLIDPMTNIDVALTVPLSGAWITGAGERGDVAVAPVAPYGGTFLAPHLWRQSW